MAEEKGKDQRSLEMRVAELEDKLAKLHITEDELKAFHKVSALTGAGAGSFADPAGGCINECSIRACTIARFCTVIRTCTIARQCTIIRQCTWECFECGGGAPGGGYGGGFGSLGG